MCDALVLDRRVDRHGESGQRNDVPADANPERNSVGRARDTAIDFTIGTVRRCERGGIMLVEPLLREDPASAAKKSVFKQAAGFIDPAVIAFGANGLAHSSSIGVHADIISVAAAESIATGQGAAA